MSISASLAQGAQIELMKAQANKANAEAENLRGVVREEATTRINKLIQETANEKTKNDLIKLEADIAEIEKSNRQYKLNAEINNLKEQTIKLKLDNAITTEAYDEIVQEIQGRAVKQGVDIALQEENITKNRIEQEKLSREITIMATEVVQRWASLNLEQPLS